MAGQLFEHGKDLWPEIQRAWNLNYNAMANQILGAGYKPFYVLGQKDARPWWKKLYSRIRWRWEDFRRWLSNKIYNWEDDL